MSRKAFFAAAPANEDCGCTENALRPGACYRVSADLGVPVLISQKSSIGGQLTLTLDQVVRVQPDAALY